MKVKGKIRAAMAVAERAQPEEPLTTRGQGAAGDVGRAPGDDHRGGASGQRGRAPAEEIERLHTRQERILESSAVGLLLLDGEDRIQAWNRALEEIYGLTREETIGRELREVFPLHVVRRVEIENSANAESGEVRIFRLSMINRKGQRVVTNLSVSPVGGADGSRVVTFDDVSERVKMEEQILQQERLASLGLLAAGMAHEINTPLTGISSYAQMLIEGCDPADPRRPVLEKIEVQTQRAARITGSLLNLARPEETAPEPVDLAETVREVVQLFRASTPRGRGVELRVELTGELPTISGHKGKLQQVLLNLLLNARDAVGQGGEILISGYRRGRQGPAWRSATTGEGIAEEDLPSIFDPFYTTKGRSKGTGLGLSIAYGIVHEHRGEIRVESVPGGVHQLPRGSCPSRVPRRRWPRHGDRGDGSPRASPGAKSGRRAGTGHRRRAGRRRCASRAAGPGGLSSRGRFRRRQRQAARSKRRLGCGSAGHHAARRRRLDVLRWIRERRSDLAVVMITAYGSVESAVVAMKAGAFHYLTKPFKNDEVRHLVSRAVQTTRLRMENKDLRRALKQRFGLEKIIGKSRPMQEVYGFIDQVAQSRATVLIQGESGTGKELVAQAIHQRSRRQAKPFLVVNSSSIPTELLEDNLFGHVKGAFTGATGDKSGLLEASDGGTVLFDEITTVGPEVQAKLLRVIQSKEFIPLGSVRSRIVDVRIIAATNEDIKGLVEQGRFRDDLYYRLNVISVTLPPLRERLEDLPLLVAHFLERYNKENQKDVGGIAPEVLERFLSYGWPGNVRSWRT